MKPYSQDFKHAYTSEFFRQLWSEAKVWGWLAVEPMVGSVFIVEDGDVQTYCTPAVQQYLGGEDFPDDDNVGIHFQYIDSDGHWLEDRGWVCDFVLTYNLEQDLHTYHTIMTAYRTGLLRQEAVDA